MKVMVIIKATQDSERGEMPSPELLAAMGQYNEELAKAGVMLDGAGLHPSSQGARVHFSGQNRAVIDGPFAETKELIAGFWIWRVKSMQEAIDWLKRCPNPTCEDSDVEIRPLFEAKDFGEAFTPELREQEANILAMNLGLGSIAFQNGQHLNLAGLNQHYTKESCTGIPNQWERFVPHLERTAGLKKMPHYGVHWNATAGCEFDYLTGGEVDSGAKLPSEFSRLNIAPSRYAVFAHTGHVSTIGKTIEAILSKWAPDCGLKLSQAPSFERYTADFNPKTGLGGIEFWMTLAAK